MRDMSPRNGTPDSGWDDDDEELDLGLGKDLLHFMCCSGDHINYNVRKKGSLERGNKCRFHFQEDFLYK